MDTAPDERPEPDRNAAVPRRELTATIAGTVLEWYDFAVYAALAAVIGPLFFPQASPATSVLLALATFGVSFAVRPLGAAILGGIADRSGRRIVLVISMVLMGGASLAIGLLPTYADVGVLASVLLVLTRVVQGFAASGEYTGAITYLIEHSSPHRRGFYGSVMIASNMAGSLLGSSAALLLVVLSPDGFVRAGGWRIPFLLGAVTAVVGFVIRRRLAESPVFVELKRDGDLSSTPVREAFRHHRKAAAVILGLVGPLSILGYACTTFAPFVQSVVGTSATVALTASVVSISAGVVVTLAAGRFADRWGGLSVTRAGLLATVLLTYPAFLLITAGGWTAVVAGQLLFTVCYAVAQAPTPALYNRMLPARVRATAYSVSYNIGTAVFGGTAPFVIAYVAGAVRDSTAPAYYLIAAALVALSVVGVARRMFRPSAPAVPATRSPEKKAT
jgi:MFS transporter, MHS family, proline/betaine transporter